MVSMLFLIDCQTEKTDICMPERGEREMCIHLEPMLECRGDRESDHH